MDTVAMDGLERLREDMGLVGDDEAEKLVRQLRRRLWRHREDFTDQDWELMGRVCRWLEDPRL